jgi:hypothetical protein
MNTVCSILYCLEDNEIQNIFRLIKGGLSTAETIWNKEWLGNVTVSAAYFILPFQHSSDGTKKIHKNCQLW